MTGQGWVTGSDIRSRPPTKEYREGWERIFGKKEPQMNDDEFEAYKRKAKSVAEIIAAPSPYFEIIENGNRPTD